jgi:hypothetical protein
MASKIKVMLSNAAGLLMLPGCVGGRDAPVSTAPPPMAMAYGKAQPLVGWDVKKLTAQYGEPRLDIRDRTVRKLQFVTGNCVLDTYLYAPSKGREPVVTHIDTRHPDGSDADPASCGVK